jgi:hypothetical protein
MVASGRPDSCGSSVSPTKAGDRTVRESSRRKPLVHLGRAISRDRLRPGVKLAKLARSGEAAGIVGNPSPPEPCAMCIRFLIAVSLALHLLLWAVPTGGHAGEPRHDLIACMGVGGAEGQTAHVLGFIRPDGSGERYPDFDQPNQRSWVFGPLFADGRRLILTSFEDTDTTNIRSGKVVTHDWLYDLESGDLQPVLEHERQADQLRPYALLPGESRMIQTAYIGN